MNADAIQATADQNKRWVAAFAAAVAVVGSDRAAQITNRVIRAHEADGEIDWRPHYENGIEELWMLARGKIDWETAAEEYEEILAAQEIMNGGR